VPIARTNGRSLNYSDGSSHRPGTGNHHDGLVWRVRGVGIRTWRARVSMGRFLNLFMLLTFAYVMVNYYDSSIPGLGFSIKGFIDGGTISSSQPDWVGWFKHDAKRDSRGIFQDRAVNIEQHDESLLRDRVLPCAIPVSCPGRDRIRNCGLWSDCGNDHRTSTRSSASHCAPLRGLGSSQNKFADRGKERLSNFFRAPPRKQTFGTWEPGPLAKLRPV
jgi:hypothetical protein